MHIILCVIYKSHMKKSFYELTVVERTNKIYKCTHCNFVKVLKTIIAIAN